MAELEQDGAEHEGAQGPAQAGQRSAPAASAVPAPTASRSRKQAKKAWWKKRQAWLAIEQLRRAKYYNTRDDLRAMWPDIFADDPKPLAVGIFQPLAAAVEGKITRIRLRRFLRRWTGRAEYVGAIVAGKPRMALIGGQWVEAEYQNPAAAVARSEAASGSLASTSADATMPPPDVLTTHQKAEQRG